MSWEEEMEHGRALQERLKGLRFCDLNPTFEELRSIIDVMNVGYGHGANRYANGVVEKILAKYDSRQTMSQARG